MNFRTRSLTLALATGLFGPVPFAPLALAEDDAQTTAETEAVTATQQDEQEEQAAEEGFSLPEPEPVHDYEEGPDAEGFSSFEERVGYAIGVNIGLGLTSEFEQMEATLDTEALVKGLEQSSGGAEAKLSEDQVNATLGAFQTRMFEKEQAKAEEQAAENRKAAEAFFAENAEREGVVTTESGLQYKFDETVEGAATATEDQLVNLHYRGTLLDGTEFDSSFEGEPTTFSVGSVIPGFNEALQLMSEGTKGTIWIPSDLAYGISPPRGTPIEPGSALVFELEIISIQDQEPFEDDFDEAGSMPEVSVESPDVSAE